MRYRIKFYIILIVVLVGGCAREEVVPLPLPKDKLVDVLIDVHLAEAMLDKLPSLDQDTVGKVYYQMIFREHEINRADFDESMNILREDPERLNLLYEEILDTLNVLEAGARGMPEMED